MTLSDSVSLPLEYKKCCKSWENAHDYGSITAGQISFYTFPSVRYLKKKPQMSPGMEYDFRTVKRCPWCGKNK